MGPRPVNWIQELHHELISVEELREWRWHPRDQLGREAVGPYAWDRRPACRPAIQARDLAQQVFGIVGIWNADNLPEHGDAEAAHGIPEGIERRIVEHTRIAGGDQRTICVIESAHTEFRNSMAES